MGTNAVQRDATAEAVSANVNRLRAERNLGLRGLSKKLGEVGRPLGHNAVDQIEKGTRRVDVDDLVALALALDVSPITLLMPDMPGADDPDKMVVVVGMGTDKETEVPAINFWRWLKTEPGSSLTGIPPMAFMANTWPQWEQVRWIKEPSHGDD